MEERKRDWGPHHATVDSDDVSIPEAELQFHASVGRVLSRVVVIHCPHQLHAQQRKISRREEGDTEACWDVQLQQSFVP